MATEFCPECKEWGLQRVSRTSSVCMNCGDTVDDVERYVGFDNDCDTAYERNVTHYYENVDNTEQKQGTNEAEGILAAISNILSNGQTTSNEIPEEPQREVEVASNWKAYKVMINRRYEPIDGVVVVDDARFILQTIIDFYQTMDITLLDATEVPNVYNFEERTVVEMHSLIR